MIENSDQVGVISKGFSFVIFISDSSNRIEVQIAGTDLGLEKVNEVEYDEDKEARKDYSYRASAEAAAILINDFHRWKDSLHLVVDNLFGINQISLVKYCSLWFFVMFFKSYTEGEVNLEESE